MKEFRADLHCHTTCSDGTSSPEDVIRMAAELGLSGLSITDHDTIDAYSQVLPLAQQLGMEIIPGVEFSSFQGEVSVHVLAYSFPIDSPIIKDFCKKHVERRLHRNREILKKLAAHGFPLEEEDVLAAIAGKVLNASRTIGRPHIALAMLKKGYIHSIPEAFNKYLGEGKSCYAPGEYFTLEDTINIIHQAKGLAIIAHPHLVDHPPTLKKLLEMNFDGIECYYAKFNQQAHKRWLKIAKHRKWLITGGSDYHGALKPHIPLGSSWVAKDYFDILKEHFDKVSLN
ncbi:PHP domain-containing protein [Neochlamydia sp. S13]|uniref:PHP domain-containing protein n=1 Tax=Neochlamydia sp. S13 TaxID=1353976 RepID=UPI0005A9A32F|nr:PHP domain-containing protein [Neochlamydia sp. S13]BBI17520.1 Uncharacterized protein NCS13_1_1325 [Neochlamydia sp. S13]